MVKRITKIVSLLSVATILFSNGCSKKDEIAFKKAEETFNAGKITEAKELYTQFVKDFPTSKWRQVSEVQLKKCNDVYELLDGATRFENEKLYGQAQINYYKISLINPNFVDISKVSAVLSFREWWDGLVSSTGRIGEKYDWWAGKPKIVEKYHWVTASIFIHLLDHIISNVDSLGIGEFQCCANFTGFLLKTLQLEKWANEEIGRFKRAALRRKSPGLSQDFIQFIQDSESLHREFELLQIQNIQDLQNIKQSVLSRTQELKKDLFALTYFRFINPELKNILEAFYIKAGIDGK